MSTNFTYEHKLIENISSQGWFTNPAGRQGYEVILLERVGDGGTRFYYNLKPGETLRFSERVFGKYIALCVDIRHARAFPIEGKFAARERGRIVYMRGNVRYRVTDAKVVAMETVDPLGELRDRVIAALHRELSRYAEAEISPALIERVIRQIGPVSHLGLTVEDAEVLEFSADGGVTKQVADEEGLQHELRLNRLREQAALDTESERNSARIRWQTERQEAIDLTNVNALMHQYPDLVPGIINTFAERERRLLEARATILGPAIKAYIEQQQAIDGEVDPARLVQIMREVIDSPGGQLLPPIMDKQIVWGGTEIEGKVIEKPSIEFKGEQGNQEGGKKPPEDRSRIKFGS